MTLSSCLSELDQYPKTETTSSDVYAEAKTIKWYWVNYMHRLLPLDKKEGNNDLSSNSGEDYMRVILIFKRLELMSWLHMARGR